MKIFLIVFSILTWSNLLYSEDLETDCLGELDRYFANPVNAEKAKKFLSLKGQLTIHRIGYAMFHDSTSDEALKVELKIMKYLGQMDALAAIDPEFKAAKESFEKNPLSRAALAKVMPYIKNVLNTDVTDPVARSVFLLDEGDMKILDILGEVEYIGTDGKYRGTTLSSDLSLNRSVMNFVRQLDYALKGVKFTDGGRREAFVEKMEENSKKVRDFMRALPISEACMVVLDLACPADPGGNQKFLSGNFVDFAKKYLKGRENTYLRWGSFWTHIGHAGASRKTTTRRAPAPRRPKPVDLTVYERELYDQMADRVLAKYDYFFEKADLLADPELLMAIIQSMDQGSSYFAYKGRRYFIPSINGTDSADTALDLTAEAYAEFAMTILGIGEDSYASRAGSYVVDAVVPESLQSVASAGFGWLYDKGAGVLSTVISDDDIRDEALFLPEVKAKLALIESSAPSCALGDDGELDPEFHKMLAYAIIGADRMNAKELQKAERYPGYTPKHSSTFVFNNKQCDARTGKHISPDPAGFLTYKRRIQEADPTMDVSSYGEKRWLAIHAAIERGDKAYIFEGKLYRLSGVEVYYPRSSEIVGLDAQKVLARINGDDYFLLDGVAYTAHGTPVAPLEKKAILDQYLQAYSDISFSSGTSPEKLSPWIVAIDRGENTFEYGGTTFSTKTGQVRGGGTERVGGQVSAEDYSAIAGALHQTIDSLNASDDERLIVGYHKELEPSTCGHYTVVDKKKARLTVYKDNGVIIYGPIEVLVGRNRTDARILWTDYEDHSTNGSTNAGIFSVSAAKTTADSPYYAYYDSNLIDLIPEDGSMKEEGSNAFAMHQIPRSLSHRYNALGNSSLSDNRVSGGCVNLRKSDLDAYKAAFPQLGCEYYVLPEEDGNRFQIIDGDLKFTPKSRSIACASSATSSTNGCDDEYRYSPSGAAASVGPDEVMAIDIRIDTDYETGIFEGIDTRPYILSVLAQDPDVPLIDPLGPLTLFVNSIEREKSGIMATTELTNEEYNELAKIAVGIMGVESEFCMHYKYLAKESRFGQTAVTAAKAVKEEGIQDVTEETAVKVIVGAEIDGISTNSRGCTQIKNIELYVPGLNGDNLKDPAVAGGATMYVLASMYKDLKRKSEAGEIDAEIIFPGVGSEPTNISDYLYYMYNGGVGQLESGVATPEFSQKVIKMKGYMEHVQVYTDMPEE